MQISPRLLNCVRLLLSASVLAGYAALGRASPVHADGTIVLYTAGGMDDFYKDVLPAFEAKEGVRVTIVTGGSGELVNRLIADRDDPKADLIVTVQPFIQQAASDHVLETVQIDADAHMPANSHAPDGAWRTFVDNYFCFGVNPDEVKTLPTTFADLLQPDLAGRIAYSNPATAGDGMAFLILTIAAFGEEEAFNYLKQLENNVKFHTRGSGYLDVLLNEGEIGVANGDLQMDLADAAGAGLSIEPIFLAIHEGDPGMTFSLPTTIGLVARRPNQAAGRRLIEYLLSPEVQAKVDAIYGISARNDVRASGPNAAVVQGIIEGVKVIPVDWIQIGQKKAAWLRRFKDEVIGNSGKLTEVVAPK